MSGPIDDYLGELARALLRGLLLRRRILAEAEDHLREAARTHGEAEAVARFGPAREVARGFLPLYARSAARLAALATLAVALSVPALYPVVENNLPAAPWPRPDAIPSHLAWKQDAVAWLFAAGAVATAVALAALAHRWLRRVVLAAAATALAALSAMTVVATVLSFQWREAVPGTPAWTVSAPLLQLGLAAGAALVLRRALALQRAANSRS